MYSDAVTTVSPTYAQEILSGYYGEGLDGVLRNYAYKLTGILNGIDLVGYNPETDPSITKIYSEEHKRARRPVRKRYKKDLVSTSMQVPLGYDY